jgi:hypothetical protein
VVEAFDDLDPELKFRLYTLVLMIWLVMEKG